MHEVVELKKVYRSFTLKRNPVDSLKVRVLGLLNPHHREKREKFWAVKDVSLQIRKGEFVGLIGPNGSGKSTLLRLIARIFPPTQGQVITQGRIVPMIELGIGFNPDLNGRENIYLNTSLYGLSRNQTDQIYRQIVDFSEIEEFIEMPVKNYSLGMYMRLGFSVAVHLDPDILLIDEVLAVGDEHFQKKCLQRMREIHGEGKTIILVSHDLTNIEKMCDRVYLLKKGSIVTEGDPLTVSNYYRNLANA